MNFLFFDEVKKKPHLIPALIGVSSVAIFLLNIYGLTLGITYVLPHLFYIPLILTGYYYPRRGVLFAAGLSVCYCIVSITLGSPTAAEVLSAIARCGVFIVIGGVVSYLSGRMHQDAENARRLASLVRSSGDAINGVTPGGIITGWNAAAETLYGYTSREMAESSIFRLIPPDLHEEQRRLLKKIVSGDVVERVETERITKDGTHIQVSLSLSPILNNVGEIIGISDVAHDITETRRFQNEIFKAKDRWERTFNAVPDMMAIIDDTFHIVQVNTAMADRLGVSPEDAVGLTCYEVVHHTDTPPPICPHQLLLRDSQSHSADIHEDNLNGDFFLTVSPIRDSSGAVLGSVHILRDVSERKRAEDRVRESEEKFREIFNSANDGIHLHEMAEDGLSGKFFDVNEVACRLLQYSKEELLEMSPLDLASDHHSYPLDRIGKEIQTTGSAIFETEFRRKDGGIVPVEVNVRVVVIQGKSMVLSIVRDLTRRKWIEEALRESEMKYRTLFDNMLEGFAYCRMIYDTKGGPVDWEYLDVNRSFGELTGLHDIKGRRVVEAIPDIREQTPELFDTYGRVAATGVSETFEIDFKPLMKWLRVSVFSPEKGYFVAVFEDITEAKYLEYEMIYHEQELIQFSKALGVANKKLTLLSGITRHDINNQLTALMGYLSILEDMPPGPPRDEFFRKAGTATERIADMIRFTKEYEGIGVVDPVWQVCRTLVDTAAKEAPLGTVVLKNDLPAGLEVFADPLIVKVIYNLMDNAVRYGGKITTIRFSARDREGEMILVCEDDGNGIPVEEKTRIFERGVGKNTGMGLFLSTEILSISDITIAETGEPGTGARFEITVPRGMYRCAETNTRELFSNGITPPSSTS